MKTNLQAALEIAIHALENDFVSFNWSKNSQCNCGIVVQALTGKSQQMMQALWREFYMEAFGDGDGYVNSVPLPGKTWRDAVQKTCSVTGTPLTKVLQYLLECGLKMNILS